MLSMVVYWTTMALTGNGGGDGARECYVDDSGIIPGDWGKIGSGWLARSLEAETSVLRRRGRIHQFLWRRSRAVSNANQEAGGQER